MTTQADPATLLMRRAVVLAESMPNGLIQTLAQVLAISSLERWPELRLRAAQALPQQHLRSLVNDFLVAWRDDASELTPRETALILRTAALATSAAYERQSVELVWTGPTVQQIAMRRTDQALLQLINSATHSLLIVSFAVYKIPTIATALIQAAQRGVSIQICVEAPEPSGQTMAYDTIKALGAGVAQYARIYIWPHNQRLQDASGHVGVLHVKCAVADSKLLFISSANLTDHAFNRNMELGVLITGGTAPSIVAKQFDYLKQGGVLSPIDP